MTESAQDAIFRLLGEAGGRSISPEAVARAIAPQDWRRRLKEVRGACVGLAREGRLVILRHGAPADPSTFKGVYRLRAPTRDVEPEG